jgi:hypothetical protein
MDRRLSRGSGGEGGGSAEELHPPADPARRGAEGRRRGKGRAPPQRQDQTGELAVEAVLPDDPVEVAPTVHVGQGPQHARPGGPRPKEQVFEHVRRAPAHVFEGSGPAFAQEAEEIDPAVRTGTKYRAPLVEGEGGLGQERGIQPGNIPGHHHDLVVALRASIGEGVPEPLREAASALRKEE